MMKFLITFFLMLSFVDGRTLPEDEEGQTVFHNLDVACHVQNTSLKICRECDPRYTPNCINKLYSDCRCGDISFKNDGNLPVLHFSSTLCFGSRKKVLKFTISTWPVAYLPAISAFIRFSSVSPLLLASALGSNSS